MNSFFKYAPVIIPTLNRFEHLKRLIDSLLCNPEAKETELVIGVDYPPADKYVDGWNKIKDYLPSVKGFGKVTIIEAKKNLGPVANLEVLRNYVFSEGYDRYIVSEDDNEFSPNFLAYMNWGLEKYKNDDRVMAVSGYNYPIDITSYDKDYYFSCYFAAWGCGRMKKNDLFIREHVFKLSYLRSLVFNPFKLIRIYRNVGWSMVLDMFSLYKNKKVYGDSYMTYYQQIENKYCVFPTISKVRNWGHDGSGLHCGDVKDAANLYHNQVIDQSPFFPPKDDIKVEANPLINKKLKAFFNQNRPSLFNRLINHLKK